MAGSVIVAMSRDCQVTVRPLVISICASNGPWARSAHVHGARPTHRIEQLTGERDLEARARDLGDVASVEGQRREIDNVLHDRLADGADQVEQGVVGLGDQSESLSTARRT